MSPERLKRHLLVDRLVHWGIALLVFILLGTGLPPQFDIDFDWVVIHWVTGVLLLVLVLFHLIRSLFWKKLRLIWFQGRDFKRQKPGKYSLAQKLMHNFIAVITLAALVTGTLMLVRIDTPFWERNPYWLDAETWGIVYVIHGLAAILFVSTLMLHIYFSLRPEKRMYLGAMFRGWVDKDEYLAAHDSDGVEG